MTKQSGTHSPTTGGRHRSRAALAPAALAGLLILAGCGADASSSGTTTSAKLSGTTTTAVSSTTTSAAGTTTTTVASSSTAPAGSETTAPPVTSPPVSSAPSSAPVTVSPTTAPSGPSSLSYEDFAVTYVSTVLAGGDASGFVRDASVTTHTASLLAGSSGTVAMNQTYVDPNAQGGGPGDCQLIGDVTVQCAVQVGGKKTLFVTVSTIAPDSDPYSGPPVPKYVFSVEAQQATR